MSCCKSADGMSPTTMRDIRALLQQLPELYPHTVYSCVLDRDGVVVASVQEEKHEGKEEDLPAMVVSLKRAAMQFVSILEQADCPVIHIKGEQHMFSCFDVGEHLLASYAAAHGGVLHAFSTVEADEAVKETLAQLQTLLAAL
eukprot:PLAT1879.2.p1 GENE.PLAT1879.2~~PLAT1879.2.p1  ORF type:complete len:143 (-),score=37.91 PLAT1879.2:2-430(-)